jgi:hypothetical protein
LTNWWAIESKNILVLTRKDFNLDTPLIFAKLISKYFVGGDAKIG